jgi:hypothetical protein
MTCNGPSKSTRSGDWLAISMIAPTLAPTMIAYALEQGAQSQTSAGCF